MTQHRVIGTRLRSCAARILFDRHVNESYSSNLFATLRVSRQSFIRHFDQRQTPLCKILKLAKRSANQRSLQYDCIPRMASRYCKLREAESLCMSRAWGCLQLYDTLHRCTRNVLRRINVADRCNQETAPSVTGWTSGSKHDRWHETQFSVRAGKCCSSRASGHFASGRRCWRPPVEQGDRARCSG